MPTNRRRSMRRMTVSGEAATWLATDDAKRFFTDPDTYLKGYRGNPYTMPVQKLPGVRPWWSYLWEVLSYMRAGKPLEGDTGEAEFVRGLEAAWNESR